MRVREKGHETLIEIETPESVESARDEKQKKAFKQWSERSQQRHFRRIITQESRYEEGHLVLWLFREYPHLEGRQVFRVQQRFAPREKC